MPDPVACPSRPTLKAGTVSNAPNHIAQPTPPNEGSRHGTPATPDSSRARLAYAPYHRETRSVSAQLSSQNRSPRLPNEVDTIFILAQHSNVEFCPQSLPFSARESLPHISRLSSSIRDSPSSIFPTCLFTSTTTDQTFPTAISTTSGIWAVLHVR
jgi:hypothetical protein